MRDRRADRSSTRGRRLVLVAVAVLIAAGGAAGVLVATAGAAADCPTTPGTFDTYTPTTMPYDWTNTANWSTGLAPTSGEVACWGSGTTVTVSDTETVDSIQADGDLDITTGALTISSSDPSTVGDLTIDGGGTLDGGGQSLTIESNFNWGGEVSGVATLNDLAVTAGTLTTDATAVPIFDGGSLSVSSAVSLSSSFTVSGSPTLSSTGAITVNSNITGSGATFTAAGGVVAGTTGTYGFGDNTLDITGGTTDVASGSTLDAGTLTLTGGTLAGTGDVDATVVNTSGTVSPGSGAPGTLSVTGTYSQAATATLAIEITSSTSFSQLAVSGAATLAGNLTLSGTYTPTQGNTFEVLTYASRTGTGTFTVSGTDASSYLAEYGATGLTLAVNPTNCTGTGTFDAYTAASGDWSTAANWSLGAPPTSTEVACWAAGTTVTVSSGTQTAASLQAGGSLVITGGSLDLASTSGTSTVDGLSLEGGGTLDGGSGQTLTVSGTFDWGASGSGTAALNATGGLAIDTTALTVDGTTSDPAFDGGTINAGSSAVSITNTNFTTSGSPTLTTTSTITIGAGLNIGGTGGSFSAAGVVAGAGVAGTYGFGSHALTLTGGTTTVAGATTLDAGTLTLTAGTLAGTGDVDATVVNTSGTVSPGSGSVGTLTITGSYTQGSGGNLAIEISSSTSFSQLAVSGAASLAGDLTLSGAYTPTQGNTFEVLTYASRTGTGTLTVGGTDSTDYLAEYGATGLTLAVTPTTCTGTYDAYIGATGDWSTAANWSTGAVPTSTEVACWASTTTVTVSTGTETAASIAAAGNLDITGGKLELAGTGASGASTVDGLSLEGGGELDGPSNPATVPTLTVTGNFDWGATGTGAATLDNTATVAGSKLAINQTTGALGSLTIDGTTSDPAFDGGTITTNSPVTISNANLTDASATTLTANDGVTFAGVALANNATPGTITTTGISNTGTSSVLGFDVDLTAGTAGTLTGSLTLPSLDTAAGTTLPIASGGTLSVEQGTIAGTISGAGTFTGGASGGTTTITGTGGLSPGSVDVGTGILTVDSGAGYAPATGTTIGSGTLNLDTTGSTGSLTMTGGALTGSSGNTLTVTGNFQWTSGTVSPDGDTIATAGTITLGSGAATGGTAGAFNAASVAEIGVTGSYGFGTSSLTLTGGTTTVASGTTLTSGALTLQGGTLQDDGNLSSSVTLTGGTLDGTGTVSGSVTNTSGTVSPGDAAPGTLTITGNYSQGGSAALAVEIEGTTAGSGGFSDLAVGGSAALGGDLSVADENGFIPGLTNTFKVLSSGLARTGAVTLTGTSKSIYEVNLDANDVTLSANPVPSNIVAPSITGTPSVGQTLSCSPGSWSAVSSSYNGYTYQWNSDGSGIGGATNATYVVSSADSGHTLTCTVTAANGFGSGSAVSAGVSIAAPPSAPLPPFNITAPAVSGTPTPGNTLSCSNGDWLDSPTAYSYVWELGASPIAGATASTYKVQIADESQALTCAVTASNAGGAITAKASSAVIVAEPGTLTCAKPTGKLSGRSLGPLQLGFTRARARRTVKTYKAVGSSEDYFCLYAGWGINVGYPSTKLLGTVSRAERKRVKGTVVLALTPNIYYSLDGARPGMALSAVSKRLKLGKVIRIGANDWYIAPGSSSRGVLRVRSGIIQEVGIGTEAFTNTRAAQTRFLKDFNNA